MASDNVTTEELDDDVILLSQGSEMSNASDGNITVKIGEISKPNVPNPIIDVTRSAEDRSLNEPKQRKKVSGAERRKRRKARAALENPKSATTAGSQVSGSKRIRSPGVSENITPPPKKSQQQAPPPGTPLISQARNHNPVHSNSNFKDTILESMDYVIVGGNKTALTPGQVGDVMKNLVWELEKFIGTNTRAPNFRDNTLGESELVLRCAEERTVKWLKDVTPKLKPWQGASLSLMRKKDWDALQQQKKMVRMSVKVPWFSTKDHFLGALRSHNPDLRTRYWEVKHVEPRGDHSTIFLKMDEISAGIIQSRNFKAYWLLNEIEFKPLRGNLNRAQPEKRAANSTANLTGKPPIIKDGDANGKGQRTETQATPNFNNAESIMENDSVPSINGDGTSGANDTVGTAGTESKDGEVSVLNSGSIPLDQTMN